MRIGTWNLDGKWSPAHRQLMEDQRCDVWLLTEVPCTVELTGFQPAHLSKEHMAERRHWAAILSRRPLEKVHAPHPASAAARIDGTTYCSIVLPWRSCGPEHPWTPGNHATKMRAALDQLQAGLATAGDNLVLGGDFNQALHGPETAGSAEGRTHLTAFLHKLGLRSATAALPHQLDCLATIDHITVGARSIVRAPEQVPAAALSDHDAYTLELSP